MVKTRKVQRHDTNVRQWLKLVKYKDMHKCKTMVKTRKVQRHATNVRQWLKLVKYKDMTQM